MNKWNRQLYFEDVTAGSELPPISIPISLQRMVMEAGANRDLSSIHHDRDAARATGAPHVYANTFFILGMIERLLREWMGLRGKIRKIGPLRMKAFNSVGDTLTFTGRVREKIEDNHAVVLDISGSTHNGETVAAEATLLLPGQYG